MIPDSDGRRRATALLLAAVACVGCGDGGSTEPAGSPVVASVEIDPAVDTLFSADATVQMTATALEADGTPIPGTAFDWSTTDASVATVSSAGLVAAAGPNGEATISAAADGVTGSAALFVRTGPSGGTVVEADGAVTLTFPPGAVADPITVSVAPAPAGPEPERVVSGSAFEFGPDGTVFQSPVQLAIGYEEAAIPGTTEESELRLYHLDGSSWTEVPGSTVDVDGNTVVGSIDGFSTYGVLAPPAVPPGKVFVNHDDWPFRPTGFTKSPDAAQFARNLASWFTGGGAGHFLAFSADLALTGPELAEAMTGAGHEWTVSTAVPFSMPELLEYDGIFLAGTPVDKAVLTEYVLAGGNVYLAGGTGIGTAEEEAAGWAPFLSVFGIEFASEYNALDGIVATCSDHPLFAGVDDLYFQNGSSVSEIDPSSPDTDILQVEAGSGLFAIYDAGGGRSREITAVEVMPEGPVALHSVGATRVLRAVAIAAPEDDCSGAVPGVTFDWSSDDTDVATVDADGTVRAVGDGSAHVTAGIGGVVSNAVTVDVTLPAELAFTVEPSDVAVGAAIAPAVQVSVLDASGSVLTAFVGDIALEIGTNPGAGTLSGTTTRAAVDGVATFDDLAIDQPGAGYDLRASASGVPVAVSAAFEVLAQAFASGMRVFAAGEASCVLLDDATTWCWGDGDEGAGFGNPTGEETSVPVQAAGGMLFSAFSLEGHDADQACGIDVDRHAHCWGDNFYGQLGDGTTAERTTPTPVAGNHEFVSIANGESHTCALGTDGSAFCWGNNDDGQLGDGTLTGRLTPVPVAGGHTFTTIDAGDDLTCALDSGGATYCWGENADGQLGNGSKASASEPTPVAGGLTFELLSVGRDHVCALTQDGTAYCWGNEGEGKLGNGSSFEDRTVPTMVTGGLSYSWITAGVEHSCGVTTGGDGYCWGEGEDRQLGDGLRTSSAVPVPVQGGITFAEIAAGEDHTCARAVDGRHYCWGSDSGGAIGDGQPLVYPSPNPVVGGLSFTSLAAGGPNCGIDPEGKIYCWGGNDGPAPTLVAQGETFASVAGQGEVCALTTDGDAYCRTPVTGAFEFVPAGGLTFVSIDAGKVSFSPTRCALTDAGEAYCWGAFNGADTPTLVPGGPWRAFSVGYEADVCGLDGAGTALCWGAHVGYEGSPVAVGGGVPFVSVSVGVGHACALAADGAAYCWGANYYGQLGDGTTDDPPHATPVPVAGGLAFESITAGFGGTCAVAVGGNAYCWGDNSSGQVGIGSVSDTPVTAPALVAGGLSFSSVGAGGAVTCGLTTAGEAYCWGAGGDDVGDGLGSGRATPTLVQFPGS